MLSALMFRFLYALKKLRLPSEFESRNPFCTFGPSAQRHAL